MKWLRLAFSVILFPLSLVWYRRDIGHYSIPPRIYWTVTALWVAANIAATIYALQHMDLVIPDLE